MRHHLGKSQSSIVFVGFAAEGTLARHIIDGAQTVRVYGETIPVRAAIHTIGGFSAHADQAELLAWHEHTGAATTFLVHGEAESKKRFAEHLTTTRVEIPAFHSEFEL
jgi:metallo-beta-lactamase family protein